MRSPTRWPAWHAVLARGPAVAALAGGQQGVCVLCVAGEAVATRACSPSSFGPSLVSINPAKSTPMYGAPTDSRKAVKGQGKAVESKERQ